MHALEALEFPAPRRSDICSVLRRLRLGQTLLPAQISHTICPRDSHRNVQKQWEEGFKVDGQVGVELEEVDGDVMARDCGSSGC